MLTKLISCLYNVQKTRSFQQYGLELYYVFVRCNNEGNINIIYTHSCAQKYIFYILKTVHILISIYFQRNIGLHEVFQDMNLFIEFRKMSQMSQKVGKLIEKFW